MGLEGKCGMRWIVFVEREGDRHLGTRHMDIVGLNTDGLYEARVRAKVFILEHYPDVRRAWLFPEGPTSVLPVDDWRREKSILENASKDMTDDQKAEFTEYLRLRCKYEDIWLETKKQSAACVGGEP
jgi:hypothetical protein